MKRYIGYALLLSILLLVSASNLSGKTRGIQVSVRTSEGHTIDLYRDSYALVIGNGNYAKGWDPLPGAVRDVKEVAQALKRQGFKVTLKTDLTRDGFNKVFSDFVYKHGSGMDNRLLFYYAGHGYTQKMTTGEELGYLVMVDAPVPEIDFGQFNLHSVDMVSIVTQAKMIKAKHALFIFDSCFSGTVLNLRDRIIPASISDNIRQPVRQFITAGRANESVPDHSVFKQCFLDILEGRDEEPIRDGYLTGEELGLYLKNKVPSYNRNQHPQYGKIRDPKLDKGDFVFLLASSGAVVDKPAVMIDRKTLSAERDQLERERQELERLRLEIERKKLEAKRDRLEKKKGNDTNSRPIALSTLENYTDDIGFRVLDITPDLRRRASISAKNGVVISALTASGKGLKAGLKIFDVIKEIDHRTITSVQAFNKVIQETEKGKAILMFVQRKSGNHLFITLIR